MGERRVVIVGAVTARIAVALAMKEIEAQVLRVDDTAPFPLLARERRKAQWKNEIKGRKKP